MGLFRAASLSWFAVALAVLAHLTAGGGAPSVALLAVLGLLLTLCGMPLCRNAFRLALHGPILLGLQLVTHAGLSLGAGHGAPVHPTAQLALALGNPHAGHPGGEIHASAGHLGSSAGTMTMGGASHGLLPSPLMLGAHLAAALVVAAVLARAESGWDAIRAIVRGRTVAQHILITFIARAMLAAVPNHAATPVARRVVRDGAAFPRARSLRDLWRSPAPCRRGPPLPSAA